MYKSLSFFSGCLGLDLGLEKAGITPLIACDFDKSCRKTIQSNRPDLPVIEDITAYTFEEIAKLASLKQGEHPFLITGGPPCQAFSTAGKRQGFKDPRGNVFLHFIELIKFFEPTYAVIENVRGLLSAPLKHRPHSERNDDFPSLEIEELPGGALNHVLGLLNDCGYEISFNLYNAANFGTPQKRERVVLIASRQGKVPHLNPTHSDNPNDHLPKWRTFRDVCGDLPADNQTSLSFPEARLKFYRMIGPGQHWRHLPTEDLKREALGKSYYAGGGKTGFIRRIAWDEPAPTLVTSPTMPATDLAHPELDRPLSIEEYKRLQEFPDNWMIEGSIQNQYKQLGNAVPVGLGRAIGKAIIEHNEGRSTSPPKNFRFSRYHNTNEYSWKDELIKKASRGGQQRLL